MKTIKAIIQTNCSFNLHTFRDRVPGSRAVFNRHCSHLISFIIFSQLRNCRVTATELRETISNELQ